jgi:hypothetical protein
MFQVGSTCYQTAIAANTAAASAQSGSVVLIGGNSYILSVASVTDTTVTYDYSPLDGGATVSQTVALTPAPCGLMTADDAVTIGWLIAACWLSVYAITFLIGIAKSSFGAQNDA